MNEIRRVAVLGGGVTGLAAAHRLVEIARERALALEVVLLEASERLGGALATEERGGFTIESGADAMLTEKPWGVELSRRLGVELVGTREGERRAFVVREGRLVAVPEGFQLLAPTDLRALAASPLFSWRGKLRMALDLLRPALASSEDESVAHFVRRRLGREALERVAQPLVGGIYTGDVEQLSLAATLPRFRELERRHGSVIRGLRAGARTSARSAGARYALFTAPAHGMGALVAAIAKRLPEGVVRLRAPAAGLTREGDGWRLRAGGDPLVADALVVATPAYVAADLLAPLDAALGRALAAIDYASSATVTFAYRSADLPALRGFGFVVPAREGRRLLACTYASRKFPGRAPEGHELLRAFVGGALRPDLTSLDDESLIRLVRSELAALIGVEAAPMLVRMHRHPRAMPQYAVGHLGRVAELEAHAARLPGLFLAGAAYHGVGIPDCVKSGEAAADALVCR